MIDGLILDAVDRAIQENNEEKLKELFSSLRRFRMREVDIMEEAYRKKLLDKRNVTKES